MPILLLLTGNLLVLNCNNRRYNVKYWQRRNLLCQENIDLFNVMSLSAKLFIIFYNLANSRSAKALLVERAKMIVGLIEGKKIKDIAEKLGVRQNTVIDWRKRFEKEGVKGLEDKPRPGKPRQYKDDFRNQILKTLEGQPPNGLSCWDGPTVAQHLKTSVHAVWRVLRKEGICLQRQRSWCVSTDPEFAPKAADIVGLYLNPPVNALILSIDEKPSMQAMERVKGYVLTNSGKVANGFKSTYKRHGTLNLFAALDVVKGVITAKTTEYKKRIDFLVFMVFLRMFWFVAGRLV